MIKAGALYYAIFITVIVSIISAMSLLIFKYHSSYFYNKITHYQITKQCRTAIESSLSIPFYNLNKENTEKFIQDFDDELSYIKTNISDWGFFKTITAKGEKLLNKYSKTALVGCFYPKSTNYAFYLADLNKFLYIAGSSFIKGNCKIPKLGVKTAYIGSSSSSISKSIDGDIGNSDSKLPSLEIPAKFYNESDSIINIEEISSDTIINSFSNKTLILNITSIGINKKLISGNIVLKSNNLISIQSECRFNNVIFEAPSIVVSDKFKGNCQLIASDSISIEDNTVFDFPSVIFLKKGASKSFCKLQIGEKCEINGAVIMLGKASTILNASLLYVKKETIINGFVYSDDLLQLEGTVYGSVYANKLFLKTMAAVYENHLYNTTIDLSKLNKYYVSPYLFKTFSKCKLIKWLN